MQKKALIYTEPDVLLQEGGGGPLVINRDILDRIRTGMYVDIDAALKLIHTGRTQLHSCVNTMHGT
jgi:hypothetical protein